MTMSHEIIAYPTKERPQSPVGIVAYMRRFENDQWNKTIYKLLDQEKHYTISSGDGTIVEIPKEKIEAALDKLNGRKLVGVDAAMITKERNFLNDCIQYMNAHGIKKLYIDFT